MATTIAQLDIDVDEVTKKAGETRKKLMEIAEEMKALKKNFAEEIYPWRNILNNYHNLQLYKRKLKRTCVRMKVLCRQM